MIKMNSNRLKAGFTMSIYPKHKKHLELLRDLNNFSTLQYKSICRFSEASANIDRLAKIKEKEIEKDVYDIQQKLDSLYKFTRPAKKVNVEEESFSNEEELKEKSDDASKQPGIFNKLKNSFVNLWMKTFPQEKDYEYLINKRKEEAQNLKDRIKFPTEAEIIELELEIQPWKQGALILCEDQPNVADKVSYVKFAKDILKKQIVNSEMYEKMKKTSTFKEYEQFKEDLEVVKQNLQDNISTSYNPFIVVTKDLFVFLINFRIEYLLSHLPLLRLK